jgi:hypothetical protein
MIINAQAIYLFFGTARSLRSAAESITTPFCVNTDGARHSPFFADGLDITDWDLQCSNSA